MIHHFAYGALGHYRISANTGSIAAGAATKLIFYCRWTSATNLAVVTLLRINGIIATTAFAAGQILVQAHTARGFTAENGTPGGTALTLTGNNQKLRTSMATMGMGVVRIATTAPLAAPTWTLDANAIGNINTHSSGGFSAATPIIGSIYLPRTDLVDIDIGDAEHPIILAQNEGLAIQVTVPGTGVWSAGVTMRWAEVAAY